MSEPGSAQQQASAASAAGARRRTFRRPPLAAWPSRLRWRSGWVFAALRETFERELQERAGLPWLAVAFGAGAGAYFALPREPLFLALAAFALLFALGGLFRWSVGRRAWPLALIAVFLIGATLAKHRVDALDGSAILGETTVTLSGRVVDRQARAELRPRVVLDRLSLSSLRPEATPGRVRISLAERYGLPPLGARVSMRARLMPVGGPVIPGGYDPHRTAFFDAIGGSGFALGGWTLDEEAPRFSFDLLVANVRAAIVARIMAAEPGEAGAVAAALLVGERSALSEQTNESLRISGLFHILSISGLHMMLVAGTAFFVVRALLALSARLALGAPIRKWAAVAALLTLTAYFTLSGGGAATVRAYTMAAIMLAAIMLDRPAISMRNLAIAAFVVIALEPESVVEPGFQMSFAAVAALIAAWEAWRGRRMRRLVEDDSLPGFRVVRFAWQAILGVALTTLVAGAATGIFAAYHFERVASYSLLGNLLAAPLVSLVIMPFGLLTLVAMPFGLEALPLAVMARGIDALLVVSTWVALLPGADLDAPPIAPACLFLIVAGMVWLCLWRLRWRLLGAPAIALGLILIPVLIDRPDILVAPDGEAVAVRDPSGVLRVSGARAGSYVVGQFFDKEGRPPEDGATLKEGTRCDKLACLLPAAEGVVVSHVRDPAAFVEDCARADVIVTPLRAPADCGAALVIDTEKLAATGAEAVRIDGEGDTRSFRMTADRVVTPRPWEAR